MYKVEPEDAEKIRKAMKRVKNKHIYKRLEAVALRGEGRSNNEIAEITKYHPKQVSTLVSIYCNEGLEAVAQDRRRGGNHKNMTFEEETELLEKFRKQAKAGELVTISEIREAYDEKVGKESAASTIYLLLARHNMNKAAAFYKDGRQVNRQHKEDEKSLRMMIC